MDKSDKTIDKTLKKWKKDIKNREEAKVPQFPLWPESKRGVPSHLLRCALFTARKSVSSTYQRDVLIFSQANIKVRYSGPILTQAHLDVLEAVLHLARKQDTGSTVVCEPKEILSATMRGQGGKDRKRLYLSLTDLVATAVLITNKEEGRVYGGSLLPTIETDVNEKVFQLKINTDIIRFFDSGYTLLDVQTRHRLARAPLAQFMYGWIYCHSGDPYPVTVAYLKNLSGVEAQHLWKFREHLRFALKRLLAVKVLQKWRIDSGDILHIERRK